MNPSPSSTCPRRARFLAPPCNPPPCNQYFSPAHCRTGPRRSSPSGATASHLTAPPRTHTAPSPSSSVRFSSVSRLRLPTATTSPRFTIVSIAGTRSGCGLISTNTPYPSFKSSPTPRANCTGSRRFLTQYSPPIPFPSIHLPSTVDHTRALPSNPSIPLTASRSSSRSPSICGECDATSTFTRRQNTPRFSSPPNSSSTASGSPDTTVLRGLFDAATDSRASFPLSSLSVSSTDSSTTPIAPFPATFPSSRLRRAITLAASWRPSVPATAAAALSPMLCPSTASGSTPHDLHCAASATSIPHSTGCTTSIVPSPRPLPRSSSISRTPSGNSAASHASIASRNTFSFSNSSRPIPSHCDPCPGNTNTTRARPCSPARPRTTPLPPSPFLTASSPRASSSALPPTTTARSSSSARRVVAVFTASASSPSLPAPLTTSASAPACFLTPSSLRPLTHTAYGPSTRPRFPASPFHSSTTTCAFVPLRLNALTPLTRLFPSFHPIPSFAITSGVPSRLTRGFSVLKCRCRGIHPSRIDSTLFITPATPAAASR